jgi:hypothetical protein
MRLTSATRAFLTEGELLDPGVEPGRVQLLVGGPPTWYLKLVRKSAITLGDRVWFVNPEKREDLALVAHELVHVAQYREMGFLRFTARYLRDLAKNGFKYSKALPLEAPAYERQAKARLVVLARQSTPVNVDR